MLLAPAFFDLIGCLKNIFGDPKDLERRNGMEQQVICTLYSRNWKVVRT